MSKSKSFLDLAKVHLFGIELYFIDMNNYQKKVEQLFEHEVENIKEEFNKLEKEDFENDEYNYKGFLEDQLIDQNINAEETFPSLFRRASFCQLISIFYFELKKVCESHAQQLKIDYSFEQTSIDFENLETYFIENAENFSPADEDWQYLKTAAQISELLYNQQGRIHEESFESYNNVLQFVKEKSSWSFQPSNRKEENYYKLGIKSKAAISELLQKAESLFLVLLNEILTFNYNALETQEEKIEVFQKEFKFVFPLLGSFAGRSGKDENGEVKFNHYHYNIPPENGKWEKSPYFFNDKGFIHFTNIYALESILQGKNIRLYNLHNLNDPREFSFAARLFEIQEENIEDAKDNLYLTSFCLPSIQYDNSGLFNMWRLYGDQGMGVTLHLSLANSPKKWKDFHFSKVYYGSDNQERMKSLVRLKEEINQNKALIGTDFRKLSAFHKSDLFRLEQEVRLVFDRREKRSGFKNKTITNHDGEVIFPVIRPDLSKLSQGNAKVKYTSIPLFSEHKQVSYDEEVPLLKIEGIQIGYYYQQEKEGLVESLKKNCKAQLGYIPIIQQTELSKDYWGE